MLASALLSVSRTEAAKELPCCVTGVVTMASSWRPNSCVIASVDDPNGPAVYVGGSRYDCADSGLVGFEAFREGLVVEVVGKTAKFAFAPGIRASRFVRLGDQTLPPAPEVRLRDLDWGVMDNRRVTLRGALMEARPGDAKGGKAVFSRLLMSTPDGQFVAHVPGPVAQWRGWIDAELSLTGCAMTFYNQKAEFLGVHLELASPEAVRVLAPAPAEPFALPESPIDEVLLVPGVSGPDGHRRRVRGMVAYARNGCFCLRSGRVSLRVRTEVAGKLTPGDEVEVVGFPVMVGNQSELRAAIWRKTETRREAEPAIELWPNALDTVPSDLQGTPYDYEGRHVRLTGDWVRYERRETEAVAFVQFGNRLVRVHFDGAPWCERLEGFLPRVTVTGFCSLTMEAGLPLGRDQQIQEVDVYSAEVVPVPDAAWKAHERRRAWLLAGRGVLAALVALQCLLLWRTLRARARARHLAAIAAERKRMAGDLHDNLEQHLAGARLMLRTMVSLNPDLPDGAKEMVSEAAQILAQAKLEVRRTVWNLRSDELFEGSLEKVLKSVAKRINQAGAVLVRTALRGLPQTGDRNQFADLVFVVQEAVTNAVKHGKARNVVFASDPLPGGGFVLRVLNDGEPFDADKVLGPAAGHYGLTGMRERAQRAKFGLSWGQEGRWTYVRMEVRG
ncbi:MAG: sensor histidine kinase [Kiritimatiellia bacterium]